MTIHDGEAEVDALLLGDVGEMSDSGEITTATFAVEPSATMSRR